MLPRLSAATTPSGMPTATANTIAQGMIASVFGSREKNTSTVGSRIRIEVPRSPFSALPMKIRNCWYSGPSSPSALIRVIRSSGVEPSGSIRSTGLPVSRPRKNTMAATMNSSTTPWSSRWTMYRFMAAGRRPYFFQGFSSGRGMRSNTSPSSCRPGMAANCPTRRRLIA